MAEKLAGRHVGIEIQRILTRELGHFGVSLFREQCEELGIRSEDIKTSDLVLLSQRMIRTLRPTVGDETAQKVGKEIQKLKLLIELEGLAKAASDPVAKRKELETYSRLGYICYTVGDWNEAVGYYHKVLKLGEELDAEVKMAEALRFLGHVYKRQSSWEDALENFRRGLSLSEKLRNPAGIADAHRGMGYVYWRRGDYPKAKDHFEKALGKAIESGDKSMIGVTHIESGLVYSDIGDLDTAIEHYAESIDYLEETRDYHELSRAHNNLGDTYLQTEDWENAIRQFEQCKKVAEKINHKSMIGWSTFNTSEALAKTGRLEESLDMCERAIEILTDLKDNVGLCASYRNLGIVHRIKGDWKTSEGSFRMAEEVLGDLDTPLPRAHLHLEWGELYKDMGDKKNAKTHLKKAAEMFRTLGAEIYYKRTENILNEL
jgi:tetratricopeptide (TPR) repeat protein